MFANHLKLSSFVAVFFLLSGHSLVYGNGFQFEVSFPSSVRSEPVDGRLILMLSTNDDRQPRFQISSRLDTQLAFGMDVNGLAPGKKLRFAKDAVGYPLRSLAEVPAGEYTVQALIHVYETFHRADGHLVKLPMDNGEGQQWNRSPGNLYSVPEKITISPSSTTKHHISLSKVIPPIESPKDTKYIKHVTIESELLSEFWGRPMHLGAIVLLPEGFDEHPDARYPVMINQGHFRRTFSGFIEEPPSSASATSRERIRASSSYEFYQDWTSGRLPRMLIVLIQHANPYYDDSYGVNSANVGPYGDAIVKELIPFVEKKFRAIGEPWARVLFGGSTGGWIALAEQIFYPDFFGGAWGFCPDGIDFRGYQQVDIYKDKNAYWLDSEWKKVPRASRREIDGTVTLTMESENIYELMLGENARSGGQWDIWQAVYGPVGQDGYPLPIWDKRTGVIDIEVSQYWKENYDLRYILERDWETLGPKLIGKLHIRVGDMDNYYLERAVRYMEEFLERTKLPGRGPYYAGSIEYGDGYGHCYSGGAPVPADKLRGTYYQRLMPEVKEHMLKYAPKEADTKSWQY
jgi:hypothetical protein